MFPFFRRWRGNRVGSFPLIAKSKKMTFRPEPCDCGIPVASLQWLPFQNLLVDFFVPIFPPTVFYTGRRFLRSSVRMKDVNVYWMSVKFIWTPPDYHSYLIRISSSPKLTKNILTVSAEKHKIAHVHRKGNRPHNTYSPACIFALVFKFTSWDYISLQVFTKKRW